MADRLSTSQLGALVWLKWRLLRNSLRSRRGAANRAASALATLAALALSLVVAAGLGVAAYALADETNPLHAVARRGDAAQPLLLLFGLLTILFLMWGLLPLSLGSGSQFDPGPLLLYPVSLRKLFLIDLLSELASLASLFAAPSLLAIGVGAGLARGRVWPALSAALLGALFGVALSKLLATAVAGLLQRKRTRGETLLALLGVVGAFSGVIIGQGVELVERAEEFPVALRWTPPGALVVALTAHESARYLLALATLALYALAATALTYRLAVGALQSSGGAGKARGAARAARDDATRAVGWRLPFLSDELSAVFEKEVRYALRNAQLRVVVLMPAVVTVALSLGLAPGRRGVGDLSPMSAPYFEGVRAGLGMYYLFVIISSLTSNLFGYESAGMRALVLAPVARRTILLGKNLTMLCVAFAGAVVVSVTNRIIYGAQGWRALLFGALCFVFFAAVFTLGGNELSLRFPKRLQFGKRMSASGMAGLLMLPVLLAVAAPPALAVLAGWLARSLLVEYVILAAFAGVSVAAYALLVSRQGRQLERRELDILETVTRDDS